MWDEISARAGQKKAKVAMPYFFMSMGDMRNVRFYSEAGWGHSIATHLLLAERYFVQRLQTNATRYLLAWGSGALQDAETSLS